MPASAASPDVGLPMANVNRSAGHDRLLMLQRSPKADPVGLTLKAGGTFEASISQRHSSLK